MKVFVLDANAIVQYTDDAQGAATVKKLFERAGAGEATLAISAVNWSEVVLVLTRKSGHQRAAGLLVGLRRILQVVPADAAQAETAASLKLSCGLPLADTFAASLAILQRATLVTADSDFDRVKHKVRLLRLPR